MTICVKNLHSKAQFVNFLCYCCLKAHWSALVALFTRGWSIPLFLKACFVSLLIGVAGCSELFKLRWCILTGFQFAELTGAQIT